MFLDVTKYPPNVIFLLMQCKYKRATCKRNQLNELTKPPMSYMTCSVYDHPIFSIFKSMSVLINHTLLSHNINSKKIFYKKYNCFKNTFIALVSSLVHDFPLARRDSSNKDNLQHLHILLKMISNERRDQFS